jgi:cytochrome c
MTKHLLVSVSLVAASVTLNSVPATAADTAAGQKLFNVQCGACHSASAAVNMVGPSLFGIIGRKSGSVANFHYSTANRDAGITWNEEVLDKYLTDPRAMMPGTTMPYPGLKNAAQRADVIAYLATLK